MRAGPVCLFYFDFYPGNWHRAWSIVDVHFIYLTLTLHLVYAKFCIVYNILIHLTQQILVGCMTVIQLLIT